ncbi:uncharacterized protein MONOS_14179 [Monocercomonoides exilis]|uniref:uncharacterized protein n=1 Tax=Monocercomonoides exilis TaxID=2049356 RepID=UPI00355968DB|nr:hypothetical protein MONOS_14179 [Monocercomonoides exilis]|eukprot:MONOS_14179.1-p1 / transcript=MONOS_14179.1 / gene=MONOS_14179 / organism=Monocercomonoides_exilis_PA203 / gene_product=unspecified product / transcript_product=unspecified product / location=Mono_scaffold00951:14260-15414(-) / protein_length=385 / sequence_SO=supercontig / SO=protein_coding / is_pseudo=false
MDNCISITEFFTINPDHCFFERLAELQALTKFLVGMFKPVMIFGEISNGEKRIKGWEMFERLKELKENRETIQRVVKRRQDWPMRRAMQKEAERIMEQDRMTWGHQHPLKEEHKMLIYMQIPASFDQKLKILNSLAFEQKQKLYQWPNRTAEISEEIAHDKAIIRKFKREKLREIKDLLSKKTFLTRLERKGEEKKELNNLKHLLKQQAAHLKYQKQEEKNSFFKTIDKILNGSQRGRSEMLVAPSLSSFKEGLVRRRRISTSLSSSSSAAMSPSLVLSPYSSSSNSESPFSHSSAHPLSLSPHRSRCHHHHIHVHHPRNHRKSTQKIQNSAFNAKKATRPDKKSKRKLIPKAKSQISPSLEKEKFYSDERLTKLHQIKKLACL